MSITSIIFWITYVAGVCAAVFNPVLGVMLYLLVYHMNPETQWWGQTVRALGLRTSFTVVLAMCAGLLIRRPAMVHGAQQFPLPFVLALLFGLLAVGSTAWGVTVAERSEYVAEKYFKILVVLFILIRVVRTPTQYHLAFLAWILGLAYLGYQASGGAGISQSGRLTAGLGGPDFSNSSGLSVHMTAALPLIGALFFMARTWWARVLTLVTGALVVNTIVATRTRSVMVGLAVMAVSGVLSLPRGYRLKGLLATIAGLALSLQLTDPGWWRRMESIWNYEEDASASARLVFWQAALRMAGDYPFGIGLGNFHHVVMDYVPELDQARSAHNTFAACLAELGWPGLTVFLAILGTTLWRLDRLRGLAKMMPPFSELTLYRWRVRIHLGWHAMALRTSLLGYLACAVFTTRLFTEDLWLLLAFAMCLVNCGRYMASEHSLELERDAEPAPATTLAWSQVGVPAKSPRGALS